MPFQCIAAVAHIMSFLSGILDKLNPFSDNVDHEAIVAAEAKLAAELREKELTERGIAVVFRCHGPYPRHPDQAICDDWLQNNRTHCSKWDQSTCEHDHPPEDAAHCIDIGSLWSKKVHPDSLIS